MLFTFKDKINKMLHSNPDYNFNCNICNEIYCGKTNCHFKVRDSEHLEMTSLTENKSKSPEESAQFDYIF